MGLTKRYIYDILYCYYIIHIGMNRFWINLHNHLIPHAGNGYHPHALRHPWVSIYGSSLIALKVIVLVAVSLYTVPVRPSNVTVDNIVRLTNQARLQNKVKQLATNALLNNAAQSKANDMIRQQYFAHISPTRVTPWFWFKQAGYNYRYAGENLAIDFVESEDVINAWLASPTHRRNLLSTNYRDVGVAVASGKIDGVDSLLVVQMFGTPVSKPVTKVSTTLPIPKPAPATPTAVATIVKPPVVLGETIVVPPAVPTITSPNQDATVQMVTVAVTGRSEPQASVDLVLDGQAAGQTVADEQGLWRWQPVQPLTQGSHTFAAQATARGLVSPLSPTLGFTIDSIPPTIDNGLTLALPSLLDPNRYDLRVVTSSDATAASVLTQGRPQALTQLGKVFYGQARLGPESLPQGILTVKAADQVGNTTQLPVVDPELYSGGVVAAHASPIVSGLVITSLSRTIMLIALFFLVFVALGNLVIHHQHQRHPAIIASLLLIYLTGTLLLL